MRAAPANKIERVIFQSPYRCSVTHGSRRHFNETLLYSRMGVCGQTDAGKDHRKFGCIMIPRWFLGLMSALGQKRTFAVQKGMSALPPKADICSALGDVRFVPIADIQFVWTCRTDLARKAFYKPTPYWPVVFRIFMHACKTGNRRGGARKGPRALSLHATGLLKILARSQSLGCRIFVTRWSPARRHGRVARLF